MALPIEAASGNQYRVAHTYTDKGNPHLEGDEFSGWLAINGRTIGMTGGNPALHRYSPLPMLPVFLK
jgi:hypothetical protein